MSVSVQSIQGVNPPTQTQPAAQPPKAPAQNTAPQDKVTISPQAKQALANNAKPASGDTKDHDGD